MTKPITPYALRKLTADNLLHRLWTKAVGMPDYAKAEWMELERRLALAFFRAPGRTANGDCDMRLSSAAVERWQAGRTDGQMARASGFSPKHWGNIRRGEVKDPPLSTYVRVCQALGCGLGDLLEPTSVPAGPVRFGGLGVAEVGHGDAQDAGQSLSTLETRAADLLVDDLGQVTGGDGGGAGKRGDAPVRDPALFVSDSVADGGSGRAHGHKE